MPRCQGVKLEHYKVSHLANYLEKQLFQSAQSMTCYSNVHTVEERMKEACMILGFRILSIKRRRNLARNIRHNQERSNRAMFEKRKEIEKVYTGWKCRRMF